MEKTFSTGTLKCCFCHYNVWKFVVSCIYFWYNTL